MIFNFQELSVLRLFLSYDSSKIFSTFEYFPYQCLNFYIFLDVLCLFKFSNRVRQFSPLLTFYNFFPLLFFFVTSLSFSFLSLLRRWNHFKMYLKYWSLIFSNFLSFGGSSQTFLLRFSPHLNIFNIIALIFIFFLTCIVFLNFPIVFVNFPHY